MTDVETSDTRPVPDLFGERGEAENGVWLSFKIRPEEGNSARALFSIDFHTAMQIRGGDGVVYDDVLSNGLEEDFKNADEYLVWIDIPEEALSGAIFEIGDGIHTVESTSDDPLGFGDADPAYATRIDLGL